MRAVGHDDFPSDTQDDPARELAVLTALHQRRVEGHPGARPTSTPLASLFARDAADLRPGHRTPQPAFDQVGVNNRDAIRELVDYSLGLGHRRIGYTAAIRVLKPRSSASSATVRAFSGGPELRRSLSRHRQRVDRERRGSAHALLSLPDPPTAIVTGNNMATIGAMRAMFARGLSVPRHSIAGFDDFESADCLEPRLTLVAQPCEEIGRRAAFLLMERIAAPQGARRRCASTPR